MWQNVILNTWEFVIEYCNIGGNFNTCLLNNYLFQNFHFEKKIILEYVKTYFIFLHKNWSLRKTI